MVTDAEQHREEDRRLRELTDARNELDTMAYQVERLLAERGDAVPGAREGAGRERWSTDARQALKDQAPLDRMRTLTAELQQVYQSPGRPAAGTGPASPSPELPPAWRRRRRHRRRVHRP